MIEPKLKVYGLLWLTRRGYLRIQLIGFLVVLASIVYIGGRPRPEAGPGETLPPFVVTLVLFLDYLPHIAFVVLILAGVETWIVLRKFKKLKMEQTAQTPVANAPGSPPPSTK